jgi:two-component system, OmpR family, response regulator CpxR
MKRILVVDDAPMIRELLKGVLEPAGYEVLLAEDGEQAVHMAARHDVDLFIVDIFLPKKGGLQVMGELVKQNANQKIIAISGGESFNPDSILELASIFEVADTFTKPIDTGRLIATVKRLLGE